MFCSNCGKPLAEGSKFCSYCGAPIIETNGIQPNESSSQNHYTPVQDIQSQQNYYGGQAMMTSGYNLNPELTIKDKYFSWHGRLNRKPYIVRNIILWVATIMIEIFIDVAEHGRYDGIYLLVGLGSIVAAIAIIVANIVIAVKRSHDINHSGWWLFIPFYTFYLLFPRGTEGVNNYGPDPLQRY